MACRPCGVDRGHTRTGLAASNQAARELQEARAMERDAAQCVAWGHRRESGILRSPLEDPASHPGAGALLSYVPALGSLTDVGSPHPDWIICGGKSGQKAIK